MFLFPVWLCLPTSKSKAAFGLHYGAVDFVILLQRYRGVNEWNVVSWKIIFFGFDDLMSKNSNRNGRKSERMEISSFMKENK